MEVESSNPYGGGGSPFLENCEKTPTKWESIKCAVIAVANFIFGLVSEFFAFLAMAATYLVPFKSFDPKAEDIQKDEKGVAVQQPIILVHGYLHNSSAWIYQKRQLKKAGFENVFTVDLGAIPTKSIKDYAKVLQKRVQDVQKMTGRDDVQLIGHSMGGLVSSYYALNLAEEDAAVVTDIVTLSSPLKGTIMHYFGLGPCVRDMAPGSTCIKGSKSEDGSNDFQGLSRQIKKAKEAEKIRFFHVASRADLVVLPYYSPLNTNKKEKIAEMPSEEIYIAPHLGHTGVLYSQAVSEKVVNFLNQDGIPV